MSAFKNLFGGGNDQQNEELIEESGDHDESDGKGFMTESVESVRIMDKETIKSSKSSNPPLQSFNIIYFALLCL